ncbi:DEKNAAC103962 [Brettanomyces naardenensis]|uniref:DEKNAAC103962 n=1 Tax=Brettanomyces naardenensis TaxID=13370 RepID=A0A448YPK7_BRENA|nr:DEKNAAC103962 [Brettanomyces naardenensis]
MIPLNLIARFLGVFISESVSDLSRLPYTWYHRLTYAPGENPENVVIIGGSFAGYGVAKFLATSIPSGHTVTVIEKSPYHQHVFAFPRYCVVGGFEDTAFIPLQKRSSDSVPKGSLNVIFDECEDVTKDSVILKSGKKLPYSQLVIATGSNRTPPAKLLHSDKDGGILELKDYQAKVKAAKEIAVIGAGAVGIELSSDIKDYYGDKVVDLYNSRSHVLPRFGTDVGEKTEAILNKLGVNVVNNCRPTAEGNIVQTPDGKRKRYDVVFKCVGETPTTSPFSTLLGELISPAGHVKVNDYFQVRDNIFALGDAVELNTARAAYAQSRTVASNIVAQINHKPMEKYVRKGFEDSIHLTIGRDWELLYLAGFDPFLRNHHSDSEIRSDHIWKYFDVQPKGH